MTQSLKENKMGTAPVGKLLFSISIPIIISMIVQALYNIVDSIFVANFNPNEGTNALGLAFPIQNLLLAVSVGMAVGINALLSRSLGQKNFDKVNKIAGQGFFLMGCGYALFIIFGIFASGFYANAVSGGNALTAKYTHQYLAVICIGSLFVFVQVLTERLLQATGKSFYSMITQATGAIINIILDPIFIWGFKMEILGAAVATVIGQFVAAMLGLFFNLKFNKEIKIKFSNFKPQGSLIKEILGISIPSVCMQAIGTVMTISMNAILMGLNSVAVGVFTNYFKLQSFVFMPIFGLNNGMVPILSYNYGAGQPKRVFKTMRIAYAVAIGYTLLGLAAFQIFPDALLKIFSAGKEMIEIGTTAFRIISLSFVFAGFSIISISSCQALGRSIFGLFVSIGRQLVVLVPVALLLSLSGRVELVWWAFPIAELMSVLLCAVFMLITVKSAFPNKNKRSEITDGERV